MSPRRDGPSSGAILVERDTQLSRIRESIAAARNGAGQVLLVTADPGIGKTALLRQAFGEARNGGLTVLQANGRELEQQYPYGVVLQLFERTVSEQPNDVLLSGAASLAARLFTRSGQPSDSDAPAEPFPILHGLYWLVANLAEGGPLVIGIDDLHWADVASLRFVLYLSQRLHDLPVCLLLTARPAWSWPIELKQLADVPATELLRLPALSTAAVEELVAAKGLDRADALARDVWHATRGNPFFISARLRQVASGGAAASTVVPETLTRWVLARIERAGPAGRRTAEALAVLGGAAPMPAVAALAGLDTEAIRLAVAGLVDRGIMQANGEVTFVHPIVQDCVYQSIQPVRRGEMHLATARSLCADPAALDAAAVHLLSAPHAGEPWVVELLAAAAERALDRAAPETAAGYLGRALAEPPSLERRARLLVELARSHAAAGNGQEAVDCFSRALELSEPGAQRASVLYELGEARLVSATGRQPASISSADSRSSARMIRTIATPTCCVPSWRRGASPPTSSPCATTRTSNGRSPRCSREAGRLGRDTSPHRLRTEPRRRRSRRRPSRSSWRSAHCRANPWSG
jgi:predicted ATPase